jgi:hypothetical protein
VFPDVVAGVTYRWIGRSDLDANNVTGIVAMVEEEEEEQRGVCRLGLKCPCPLFI